MLVVKTSLKTAHFELHPHLPDVSELIPLKKYGDNNDISWGHRHQGALQNTDGILTHWPLGDLNKILEKYFFQLISVIGGWGIFHEIALRWMPLDLTDDKSTSVQVMARCHQATSHYLSQCWPRYLSPYDITRPQWVNSLRQSDAYVSIN